MNITTTLKNTKATKLANLLGANHRHVRHEGHFYFIRVTKLGNILLATAELKFVTRDPKSLLKDASIMQGQPEINLFGKDKVATELRKLCENRLYT